MNELRTILRNTRVKSALCAIVCDSTGGSGSGDVTGPSGATADNIATYNGATGKVIKDGGTSVTAILASIAANTTSIATKLTATRVVLPGDVTNNNSVANTIADVTGLEFPVVNGTKYGFRFVFAFTSQATGNGSRWSINGPAFTTLTFSLQTTTAAAGIASSNALVAYDTPAAAFGTSAGTSGNMAWIDGVIQPSANGTVIARFASELSNNAIVALGGLCYVEYWTL